MAKMDARGRVVFALPVAGDSDEDATEKTWKSMPSTTCEATAMNSALQQRSSSSSSSSGYGTSFTSTSSSNSFQISAFREDEIDLPFSGKGDLQMQSVSSAEDFSNKQVDSEEGSSESVIRLSEPRPLNPLHFANQKMETGFATKCQSIAKYLIHCMKEDGICVLDNFLGRSIADKLLCQISKMYTEGVFMDGQLVVQTNSMQQIRGDKIAWADGSEPDMEVLSYLVSHLDALMVICNGHLDQYDINGRTKAMIACYPGNGTRYVKHVDNPHEDGRCITCIYYLNKTWDPQTDGGLLKLYPQGKKKVADIVPSLDRLICFWSDSRNPHEVMPAWKTRLAITVWYFDSKEREAASKHGKFKNDYDPKYQSSALSPDFLNW